MIIMHKSYEIKIKGLYMTYNDQDNHKIIGLENVHHNYFQ